MVVDWLLSMLICIVLPRFNFELWFENMAVWENLHFLHIAGFFYIFIFLIANQSLYSTDPSKRRIDYLSNFKSIVCVSYCLSRL